MEVTVISESETPKQHLYGRVIKLGNDITFVSAEIVCKALLEFNDQSKTEPIVIAINSNGGLAFAAFEIIETIENIEAPVDGAVVGYAHSAACFILQKCRKRYMINREGVSLMYHKQRAKLLELDAAVERGKGAPQSELVSFNGHVEGDFFIIDDDETYEQMLELIASRSGQTLDDIRQWGDEERWFNAVTALSLGLVDELFDKVLKVK